MGTLGKGHATISPHCRSFSNICHLNTSVNWFCHPVLGLRNLELLHTFSISRVTISSFRGMLLLYPRQATTIRMKGASSQFPFPPTCMARTHQQISQVLPVKTFLWCLETTSPSDPGLLSVREPLSEGRSCSGIGKGSGKGWATDCSWASPRKISPWAKKIQTVEELDELVHHKLALS